MNRRPAVLRRLRPIVPAATFAACLAVAAVAGAQTTAPPAPPSPAPADLAGLEVPRPDLSAMQPAARRRIESLQEALAGLLAADAPDAGQVGQTFGFLGQVFQAMDLPGAAAEAYAVALRLAPADPRWTYYAALVAHGQGDLEPAVAGYRAYLAVRPDDLAANLRLGNALVALGRTEEARQAFAAAERLDAESAAARYGLGRVAAAAGEHATAVEHFLAVLDLAPTADAVAYQLGQSYRRLGDEERAAGFLALAGDREPGFPDPLAGVLASIEKAIAVEVVRDLAAAEAFSERDFAGFVRGNLAGVNGAAAAVLGHAEAAGEAPAAVRGRLRWAAGMLFLAAGDLAAAVDELEGALELAPALVDARHDLGNALAGVGRFEEAVESYGALLAQRPDDVATLVQRAAANANLERFDAARADLEKALEVEPGHAQAQLRLGIVLVGQGDPEAAVARLAAAAEAGKGTRVEAEAWTTMAELARGRGELADAEAAYRRAIAADPELTIPIGGLASLYAAAGRYPQAAALFNRLVALEPDNKAARLSEATVLIFAGQDAAARARLEAALERHPGDLDVLDVLSRHLAAASDRAVRDGARAVELAEQVYAAVPTLASMETLAMAHAEAGDFAQAVEWQERLLARAEEEGGEVPERLTANLELYRSRRPCCAAMAAGAGGDDPAGGR